MTWHAPEVHAHFHEHLSVRQTITTGLTGSFTPPPPETIDRARLEALMDHFALMEVADEPYRQQPAPIQRMALVGRALFKRAELILLDEPHQGLAPKTGIESTHGWKRICSRTKPWFSPRTRPPIGPTGSTVRSTWIPFLPELAILSLNRTAPSANQQG